ncbi:hypothetical protein UJ101_01166 [Flavobacteriaceae bacterium UJ101]|nr:hypothetical protein UJ101_01166 [Flavobacteriaceae bacterium UJ101]
MSEKEKLKKFLKTQRIPFSTFTNEVGVSQGFLNSGSSLGVDKLKMILIKYPQLSLDWLLFNKGDMVVHEKTELEISLEDRLERIESSISSLVNLNSKKKIIDELKSELSSLEQNSNFVSDDELISQLEQLKSKILNK